MKRRTQWSKQEHAHGVQGGGRDEPSTLQRKTQRKNTKRRQKRLCCLSGVWVEIGGGGGRGGRGGGGGGEGGGGFKLDGAKIRAKGKSRQRQKTKQTVQLRTSKIHKTRRQAGGFYIHALYKHAFIGTCIQSYVHTYVCTTQFVQNLDFINPAELI